MVVEIAIVEAKAGEAEQMRDGLTEARALLARSPGYRASTFYQALEKPERFVLTVVWESVADHIEGFVRGPLLPAFQSLWTQHQAGTGEMHHYEVFAGEP